MSDWFSPYGVSGRVGAGIVCLAVAIGLAVAGKPGASLVLLAFAVLEFVSAWRYRRKHGENGA
jgi:hypothetical protein